LAPADAAAAFGGVLVLSFGLTVFLSGAFTSYFGAGRSRKIGIGLVLVGLLTLFAWTTITFGINVIISVSAWNQEQMLTGVASVAGGVLGGVVAMALFLVSIMRA